MNKKIQIHSLKEIQPIKRRLRESANQSLRAIRERTQTKDAFRFLHQLKFEQIGCDPLDRTRPLNFIEQLNQTFTYLVSLSAVAQLLEKHPERAPFTMNLGTLSGPDVVSADGSIVAETFAATSPSSNRKLPKDVKKVLTFSAGHKYVFYHVLRDSVRRKSAPAVEVVRISQII